MNKNIYITKTLIENDNQSELDFVLQDKFGFDYESFDGFVEIQKGGYGSADATPIDIEEIIKILTHLKMRGSTHVQICDSGDHHGYDISGYEIRNSTKEEIDSYNFNAEKDKKEKIAKLYQEINDLKNS